jgi:predicted DNA binding CopG/RHH family protein
MKKDKKDCMLWVRLTRDELQAYKKLAATKGITVSALIRVSVNFTLDKAGVVTLGKLIETAEDSVF